MKRFSILIIAFLNVWVSQSVFAQSDEPLDSVETQKAKTAKVVKNRRPSYPTMEVKGVCIDAVSKAPLGGIMIKMLNNSSYTAMTDEKGEFVIKVPTFATALYVHAPQYLSQQVAIGTNEE